MFKTKIKGNSYYAVLDRTTVCIYMLNRRDCVFIDTGEIDSGRLLKILRSEGLRPRAIINTHLHIDHIGNNKALCDAYNISVYASKTEISQRNTDDEYSVCSSFAKRLIPNCSEGVLTIEGADFLIIPTPGHSPGHQAVVTPDGVCCLGDAVMSMSKLNHSRVPYVHDAEKAMESMKKLLDTDYPFYLAAHNGLISGSEIKKTIRANIEKEEKLRETVEKIVTGEISMYRLEEKLMRAAGVTNPETLGYDWMHASARARIEEVVREGLLRKTGLNIYPVKKTVQGSRPPFKGGKGQLAFENGKKKL